MSGAPTRPADPLYLLLKPSRRTAVVDIGANPIDGDPPYKTMLALGLCTVVGFEPQKDACDRLNKCRGPNEIYLHNAVADGRAHLLYSCRASGMTSLLKPDSNALRHFEKFSEWGEVIREEPINTVRLDDVAEIAHLDFLKIDAQGSELSVFRNGRTKLAAAIAVQTEVSFIALYEKQPTYGEIDIELRGLGFVPHAFVHINRRLIAPVRDPNNPYAGLNQVLEVDVLYVRDFLHPDAMSDEQLKHLALVAHHCYRSIDLAANCLYHLVDRKALPSDTLQRYVKLSA
jgi:FkbM family methyltransferase